MPGIKPGNSAPFTKKKIPKIIHPLATPGYIIVLKFITACVLNILGFALTYTLLLIAIPIALLAKFVQKIAVSVRVKFRGTKAEYGSASETFWFLTSCEERMPNLILLLTVKGQVDCEDLEGLVRNRLNCGDEGQLEGRVNFKRLYRTPKRIFHELVWLENNIDCQKTVIQADLESACLCTLEGKVVNLQRLSNSNEWQVYLYTRNGNLNENGNSVIVLQFRHCIVDLHTLVYAMSKSFIDKQVYMFREEITYAQGFCLGLLALLSGPSIFVKSLIKPKDLTFTEPPSTPAGKRAIFYSESISRSDVEIVTTATGTSGKR